MAKENSVAEATTFSKEQLLGSAKYVKRRDLLSVLLEDNKQYTFEMVDACIEKYMKGKVK